MFNLKNVNYLKLLYLFIFILSIFDIYTISSNTTNSTWFLVLLFKTNLIYVGYSIIFVLGYILLFTKKGRRVSDNKKFSLSIMAILIILSIFLTFLGNISSIEYNGDNDEALEIWINNLFSFQYPYEAVTQLGGRLTPFPFLPLYSIPFYLLGNVAYQNFINLLIILFIIWNFSENRRQLNFGLVSLSICTPLFVFFLNQSDHMTVAAFTALGIYLLYKNRFELGSVIFGLLIASKGYVWFIIPTIIYFIQSKGGIKHLKKSILIMIIIPSIFILPFILWNPDVFFHYAPIGAESSRLSAFKYLDVIVVIIISLISLFSYNKTKNLIFAVFIAYLSFELILPLRSIFLLALSAILLGIYMDKSKQNNIKIRDQNPSN